jgi:hypothetical protein
MGPDYGVAEPNIFKGLRSRCDLIPLQNYRTKLYHVAQWNSFVSNGTGSKWKEKNEGYDEVPRYRIRRFDLLLSSSLKLAPLNSTSSSPSRAVSQRPTISCRLQWSECRLSHRGRWCSQHHAGGRWLEPPLPSPHSSAQYLTKSVNAGI